MASREKSQANARRGLAVALLLAGLLTGCEGMSHTDRGALGGAALGAGAGALIGAATGNPEAGAGIGAAVGGITGAVTGSSVDRAEYRAERDRAVQQAYAQQAQAQAARDPLGLQEIADMSRSGVGDPIIIEQIRQTGVSYNLSADQIIWLKQSGVSDPVVGAMQATGHGVPARVVTPAPRRVIVEEDPVIIERRVRPVYIHRPPCYVRPRPRAGFGFSYSWGGKRCR